MRQAHFFFNSRTSLCASLSECVDLLRFSPDERFLAATGADSLLHIWDMQTGELVLGKKFANNGPVTVFHWGGASVKSRRTRYEVVYALPGEVFNAELFFDPTRQQWMLEHNLM